MSAIPTLSYVTRGPRGSAYSRTQRRPGQEQRPHSGPILGWLLTDMNYEWPIVISNLGKVRKRWSQLFHILGQGGAGAWTPGMLFKAVVQDFLLLALYMSVTTPLIGQTMGGFCPRVDRRLTGKQPWRRPNGFWEPPPSPLGECNGSVCPCTQIYEQSVWSDGHTVYLQDHMTQTPSLSNKYGYDKPKVSIIHGTITGINLLLYSVINHKKWFEYTRSEYFQ